jgi:hypothetical protein
LISTRASNSNSAARPSYAPSHTIFELIAENAQRARAARADGLKTKAQQARDPLTKWAAETMQKEKDHYAGSLSRSHDGRKYSASPWETFFTGGGIHHFENFEREDNKRILELRDAFQTQRI